MITDQQKQAVADAMPFTVYVRQINGTLVKGTCVGRKREMPKVFRDNQGGLDMGFDISWDLAHRLLTKEADYVVM